MLTATFSQMPMQNQAKIRQANPLEGRQLSVAELPAYRARLRRRGLRVVVTNGCFDLLHYGHIRYLQHARRLGDVLIVGVNGDRAVRLLKGPGRPVVPARYRAALLAALRCVDAVVVFPQKRAERFLAAAAPDIYVKAGDYTRATLDAAERRLLERLGADIRIVPFVPGFSATRLIQRIRTRAASAAPRARRAAAAGRDNA